MERSSCPSHEVLELWKGDIVVIFAALALGSNVVLVQSTVCPQQSWFTTSTNVCFYDSAPLPDINPYVLRPELVAGIVDPVEKKLASSSDGANGMGKTVAANFSAAYLSCCMQ